ncbi:MAG TPA: HAD-IIIC family phosphatase [Stellaceae bacterium]|jgi:FkbH-like protein
MRQTADGIATAMIVLPDEAARAFAETQAAVSARSVIAWGEHCTECAFPACYSTCSYYTPRRDHHCRRFENGIERAIAPNHRSLQLTRIVFRRWGKLEGQGRIAVRGQRGADVLEAADIALDRVLSHALPAIVRDKFAWRLNDLKVRLVSRGAALQASDMFVLEAWHAGSRSWPFTLAIMTSAKETAGLFQTAAPLLPGYNRLLIPVAEIAKLVDLEKPLTIQIEPVEEGAPPIVFGMIDFCRLARSLAAAPAQPVAVSAKPTGELPKLKCVVWDLDNTLWQGTLVEDGIDGVTLSQAAADAVRELDRRGIINSVASKNDPDLAFAALEKFGLRQYFVFPKVGWGPKSEAVKSIIAEMDVSADTFAFVDDQPFERGEIQELIPEIAVFSHTQIAALVAHPRCDVPITAESGKRREMYQSEELRTVARGSSTLDYADFLRSCRIKLEVTRLQPHNLLRMYELSQRTNQLNFSGRRYSQAELETLMKEQPERAFVLTCTDKFGEYGAIGFCVLMETRPAIESFFMSCRVQRKRVENAFFEYLRQRLLEHGAERFGVAYKPTKKNKASVQMLAELGFRHEADESAGDEWFVRPIDRDFADSDVVTLDIRCDAAALELAS